MKDKTFVIILAVIMAVGVSATTALLIHGYSLWKEISIVELIAYWGY
jgi:hypothetical protein